MLALLSAFHEYQLYGSHPPAKVAGWYQVSKPRALRVSVCDVVPETVCIFNSLATNRARRNPFL